MGSVEPEARQLKAFLDDAGPEGPVVMINLLRYRERAAYPEGFEAEPCSGREAYGRYGAVAMEKVAAAGGRVIWFGNVHASVIAPPGEAWDDALLVEYPSKQAFFDMVAQPDYQTAAPHRTAALADSRLIATTTAAGIGS